MKKQYSTYKKTMILPLLGLLVLIGACNKFTDVAPNNTFAEDDAYATPQRAALAITGVYSAAQSSPYTDGSNRGYPFGAASTEQGDMRGEDMIAIPSFYLITYQNQYDANSANNVAMWTSLFATINRANEVIEKLKEAAAAGTITADIATKGEAESRFLRALSYHQLLIHFARPYNFTADASHLGLPIRTTANNTPQKVEETKNIPRSSVKDCYAFVLADLDFAEANLTAGGGSSITITRATKGAAVALKTRVKLHMGDYAGVIAEGAKLGTSAAAGPFVTPASFGTYRLTATPDGPFSSATSGYANSESIFNIENSTIRNSGTNAAIGTMYSKAPGRALIVISPIIWNDPSWKANDLRRSLLATNDGRYWYSNKYKDFATFTDANPIIRYAEVLLNVAEAYARTSPLSPNALALLNAVRNRSVTNVADQYTLASFASGNNMIQSIINERRIEFLAEGMRWSDIHRLAKDAQYGPNGVPAKVSSTVLFSAYNPNVPYAGTRAIAAIPFDGGATSFRFIWPIPQIETVTNPGLAPNPGY